MNKSALYNLGCCLYSGKGTPRSLTEAFDLFQKAADLGLDVAQYRVGVCLRDGIGCACNPVLAIENFRCAAGQGMGKANVALLDLMLCDEAVDSNAKQAAQAQSVMSPAADAGAGTQTTFSVATPLFKGLKVISPVKSPLQMQDDQEPPAEHSRPATPDPSISLMHLFQLQQEFAEHLRGMRVRHEQEVKALHQHFEPLIATASSLAGRTKASDATNASHLYCILRNGEEQQHEAAVENRQEIQSAGSLPAASLLNSIPLPPSSSNSSPAANPSSTLNQLYQPSAFTATSSVSAAFKSNGSSNLSPASPLSLSDFSSGSLASSYRRSVIMRHTQNKLL
jgi:hypothetical protein